MAAFFSFDKDFQPVFIDYSLMSHANYTVWQFIFPLWALCCTECVCVCVCGFLVNVRIGLRVEVRLRFSLRVRELVGKKFFLNMEICVCVCASILNTTPNLCTGTALIFCFMARKVSCLGKKNCQVIY